MIIHKVEGPGAGQVADYTPHVEARNM